MDRLRGAGGGVVWEIWKNYAASQAKTKSSCIASSEEKKNHVCMVQPKKKFLQIISLSSKRFCLVSEQKKTEERDFRFWRREKCNESQKMYQ